MPRLVRSTLAVVLLTARTDAFSPPTRWAARLGGVAQSVASEVSAADEAQGDASAPRLTLTTVERARTVAQVAVASGGTLCTMRRDVEDGQGPEPFGSFVDYVLDEFGTPVMLLSEQSEHTLNLKASSSCSLFLQMPRAAAGVPSRDGAPLPSAALSRVTMLGRVVPITDKDELLQLKSAFTVQHEYSERLLDSPRFSLSKLELDRVYYVGGFGVSSEWVDMDAYQGAEADVLAVDSASLVAKLNSASHKNDIVALCTEFLEIKELDKARVQTIDRLGLDLRVTYSSQLRTSEYRVGFQSKVTSVEDAKSEVMKIMQEAWESSQGYRWEGQGPPIELTAEDILR